MSTSPHIVIATAENFKTAVIDPSQQRPVLIDFWAEWCAPCQSLMPILSKLADEYAGRFLLAKVNTDEQQALAMHFGVRSLPTVALLFQGKIIDQFMGAIPESQVRSFLDRHLPPAETAPEMTLDEQLQQLLAQNNLGAASQLIADTLRDDPENPSARAAEIELLLHSNHIDQADSAWQALPVKLQTEAAIQRVRILIDFYRELQNAPDMASLNNQLSAAADNSSARYQLGLRQAISSQYQAAMDNLFTLVKKDRRFQDDAGRKALLAVFQLCADKALVNDYRRQLSAWLL